MTDIGVYNPNSKYSRSLREPYIPDLPVSHAGKIRNLEFSIEQVWNMREFNYRIGDMPAARLHAFRLGTMRSELRRLRGM